MRVVEKYYSVGELALLLAVCKKTVLRRIEAQEFGNQVVNLGASDERPDYRVPASGVNGYLERRRLFSEGSEPGVAARSVGELRRKSRV